MRRAVSLLLALGLGGSFAACRAQLQCEEGSEGCSCQEDDACVGGLECVSGVCVDQSDTETGESTAADDSTSDSDSGDGDSGDGDGGDGDSGDGDSGDGDSGDGDSGDGDGGDGDGDSGDGDGDSGDGDSGDGDGGDGDGDGDAPSFCDGNTVTAVGGEAVFDDFEDADLDISSADGRSGSWIAFDDGTGTVSPVAIETIDDGYGGSTRALHLSGTGLTSWGAGARAPFAADSCYDGGQYDGVAFYAKGSGVVDVKLETAATGEAHDCDPAESLCNDHYHWGPVTLTDQWTRYVVEWDELEQIGFGTQFDFELSELTFISFQHQPGAASFDMWIDDVRMLAGETGDYICDGATQVGTVSPGMIDDFEDGDLKLPESDGRSGNWNAYNDFQGAFTAGPEIVDVSGGAPGSTRAYHLAGTGFDFWGAVFQTKLFDDGCYDVSTFDGIRFWARGDAILRLQATPIAADALAGCDPGTQACGAFESADINVTETWTQHEILWSELATPSWIDAFAWDPTTMFTIGFLHASGGTVAPDFELYIDDVELFTQ